MSLQNDAPTLAAAAATILADRRRKHEQGSRLPDACRPVDIDSALAIQAAVTDMLGESIVAWKCGMPADGRVVLAPIYAANTHFASPCAVHAPQGTMRIEPELAFILGRDLPARDCAYAPAEVDGAIVRTHLALELIESRYADPAEVSFVENLADGLVNQGLFIGPQVDDGKARVMAVLPLRVTDGTGKETLLDGRHPNADPRAPLYWLAEFLRSRGQGLTAGQAVITGSYAGSFDVPVNTDLAIQYGELGELNVRFHA
jgi:2-keto-4-pentenoate hydratase